MSASPNHPNKQHMNSDTRRQARETTRAATLKRLASDLDNAANEEIKSPDTSLQWEANGLKTGLRMAAHMARKQAKAHEPEAQKLANSV